MVLKTSSATLKPENLPHFEAFIEAEYNDAMGDGVLTVGLDGKVMLCDRVIRQRFEIYPESFIGEHIPLLWPRIKECIRKGLSPLELQVEKMGGRFSVTVSPVTSDKTTVGAVCVFVEKNQLEATARRLRHSQELTQELRTIFNSTSEGLWVCDSEGRVLRINPASERINRIKKQQVMGRNVRELAAQGLLDCSAALEVLENGSLVNLLHTRGGRKLIITGTPVFDDAGKLIRVVVTERDITEIDKLQREVEDQEALRGQFESHMLELQQVELASHRIIAKSPCMLKTLRQAFKVAGADSATLLLGESGVGKGLFADLIHKQSSRAQKPMITINCGSIPESLIESELFGHERGAFTGAQSSKPGHLEMADGGILFLDEIAELPIASQVKLLRFLEDGRVTRLGGTLGRTIDVRILAATHRDLEQMVQDKTFRLDLYYRLNVIPLTIPSLRERYDCIVPLIHHYINHFAAKNHLRKRLSGVALDALLAYPYPGNVRELMNICERLVVMTDAETIDLPDLPSTISGCTETEGLQIQGLSKAMTFSQILEKVEKALLIEAAKKYPNQYRMAKALGVNQSTIARKLKKHGIA